MSVRYVVRSALLLLCASGDDVSLYQTSPSVRSSLEGPQEPLSHVQDNVKKVDSVHMKRKDSAKRDHSAANATDEVDPNSLVAEAKCSDLKNVGPYSLIDITVGTPPQSFSIVADTGSDLVIIQDCSCSEKGLGCSSSDRCFSESSSTFAMDGVHDFKITFGSGDVIADTGTDVVHINGVEAKMSKGIVLMMDRTTLQVSSSFEGILGLGPPVHDDMYDEPLFLEEAHVKDFSICFNDYDTTGALRVGAGQANTLLSTVGTRHWSLSFEGLAVGDGSGADSVSFCGSTPSSQSYPCGAVFDTGTTYILGPQKHINLMYASICDRWPRCKEAQSSGGTKESVFTSLVRNCGQWLDKEDGLNELPKLQFKMAGANGAKQTLEISGWAYIFEEEAQKKKKTSGTPHCVPAFGDNDGYTTKEHGDVWIMGTPVYFDYVVGHNMGKPGMSFSKSSCSTCGASTSHLLDHKRLKRHGARAQPRPQIGEARRGIKTNSPL